MTAPANKQYPFFVYGTLRPGQPNYGLLKGRANGWKNAVLYEACIYSLGQFPMAMMVDAHPEHFEPEELRGSCVHGQLVTAEPDHYSVLLNRLDDLEGYFPYDPVKSMYHRLLKPVITTENQIVEAWVYLGNPAYLSPKYPRILSGDWVAYGSR